MLMLEIIRAVLSPPPQSLMISLQMRFGLSLFLRAELRVQCRERERVIKNFQRVPYRPRVIFYDARRLLRPFANLPVFAKGMGDRHLRHKEEHFKETVALIGPPVFLL